VPTSRRSAARRTSPAPPKDEGAPGEPGLAARADALAAELGIGDAVVHLDYGLARVAGLEPAPAAEAEAGEALRLEFRDGATLLVPVTEMDRVWRYGGDPESAKLDRLTGGDWPERRAAIEAEVERAAAGLAEAARRRAGRRTDKLRWPAPAMKRFAAGFGFAETPDQRSAIEACLADLKSGRPMSRLVCGDVGYGKTEVALRAAAAVALGGKQVALVAPTTVLVRQHLATLEKRFAGTGLAIGQLSRLVSPAEARRVKAGLASGEIRIVVGTHAVAARRVRFAELGLVVIDEEQRFGAAVKTRLRALGEAVHRLTLTATPIPRTLLAALAGLIDVSTLETPPAERRPVRTTVAAFEDEAVRHALLAEKARGGQSFVVCPRIEDLEPMRARLARIAPELDLKIAHGKMPADEADAVMVGFAEGEGDVLLATNIIESGLDVPRANTMVVWRADRFGLAQTHQLRGRVGRGRAQGVCLLTTDPEAKPGRAAMKRLETLAALNRLGAGFEIARRDLDQRGAGDLLGEDQAGHAVAVGAELYRHLLERALAALDGEQAGADLAPTLNLGLAPAVPERLVPDPEARLSLYARWARAEDDEAVAALAERFAARHGERPETEDLWALARVRVLARTLRATRIDAGPKGAALTFAPGAPRPKPPHGAGWAEDRLIVPAAGAADARERLARVEALLRDLAG
jgi:transcription-repair coupling factor (superfamily II helicase)